MGRFCVNGFLPRPAGLLTAGLCLGLSTGAGGLAVRPTITRILFVPVPCAFPDCQDRAHHGNVRLAYSDGTIVTATTTADVVGGRDEEADPKLSPDHRMAGWLRGEHVVSSGERYFAGTALVLYQSGRVVTTIRGDRYFIEAWRFWDEGRRVALRSRAEHGVATVELHDTHTGREVAEVLEYQVTAKSPAWARSLVDAP